MLTGAVADWIYRYAAGIDTIVSDPGFHTIYLHPNFDSQLGSVELEYQSNLWADSIRMVGQRHSGGLEDHSPPQHKRSLAAFIRDGQPLDSRWRPDCAEFESEGNWQAGAEEVFEVPAGTYTFKVKLAQR